MDAIELPRSAWIVNWWRLMRCLLELFFDLVFVFAVSQLSDHLLTHPDRRGAGQTLVLLVAVFGIWSHTSFGVSMPGISHPVAVTSIFTIMFLGLFMNAGISDAFADRPWNFAAPFTFARQPERTTGGR